MKFFPLLALACVCELGVNAREDHPSSTSSRQRTKTCTTRKTSPSPPAYCTHDKCFRDAENCPNAKHECSQFLGTKTITPSAVTVTTTISTTVTASPSSLVCSQDACLQNFQLAPSSTVSAFCAAYTATTNTLATQLPGFAVACPTAASSISSVCSCYASARDATATASTSVSEH